MTIKKVPTPAPQPEEVPVTESGEQRLWEALGPATYSRWTVFEPTEDEGPPEEE